MPGNENLSLVITTDLIFKAWSPGLGYNTQQLAEVVVMLVNFCYFPH